MRNIPIAAITLLLAHSLAVHADSVKVTWGYNSQAGPLKVFAADGTTPLPGADTNGVAGTGYALELGYYSQASAQNPFAGTWKPVFGKGSANPLFSNASLGDGRSTTDASDIRFGLTGVVDTTVPGTLTNLPAPGQIMAIRFYSANQAAGAAYYGAASNTAWKWVAPSAVPPVPLSYNINQGGTLFQGAAVAETNQRTFIGLPQITSQPDHATSGASGSPITLTVGSTGPGLSYQWYLNGQLIAGATGATYDFTLDGPGAGTYTVVITDAYGDTVTGGPYEVSISAPSTSPTDTPAMPLFAEILLGLALMVAASRLMPKQQINC